MSVVHTLLLHGVTVQVFTVFNNLIPCFFYIFIRDAFKKMMLHCTKS